MNGEVFIDYLIVVLLDTRENSNNYRKYLEKKMLFFEYNNFADYFNKCMYIIRSTMNARCGTHYSACLCHIGFFGILYLLILPNIHVMEQKLFMFDYCTVYRIIYTQSRRLHFYRWNTISDTILSFLPITAWKSYNM